MSREELKKVGTEVDEEVLISLKILALRKRVTLGEYVKEILDKHVSSKNSNVLKEVREELGT